MIDASSDPVRQRLIALTRDLILIPSIPSRPEDRRRCYEFVKNHLEAVNQIEIREHENQGIPSMIAGPAGVTVPEVLLCAHLDVITHPDINFYKSEIRQGRIYGPGAGDMKGTLAILMELFREIHQLYPGTSLSLAVTSDEETGGEHGIGFLVRERGLRCRSAIIPDGGSLQDITVDEKGILHLKVHCQGHPAHAARPWLGHNPIQILMHKLGQLQDLFQCWKKSEGHWFPTCSITVIGTENETVNRIPADAHAVLDIRFTPPETAGSMLEKIRDCLGPEVSTHIIVSAETSHLSPDPLYVQVTEEITGQPARLVQDCGGSDARFLTQFNIPVLMSRPLVGNLHAADEWIDIDSMMLFHQICLTYLTRKLKLA